ncbi:MAG: TonB-dependent receptor, partial [Rhizobium sp.]|nr:TonB-dependent receptor [Rhizobium sp.]
PKLTVDATAFYNRYTRSLSYATGASFPEATPPPPHLVLPVHYGNRAEGELYGMEISAKWQVSHTWRLSGSYSLNLGHIGPIDPGTIIIAGRSPHHGAQIRSHLDLPGRTEFDAAIYYVSKAQLVTTPPSAIPAYARLDLRFGWQATDRLYFSLAGQNLLQSRHLEHTLELTSQAEVPRSANLTVTARF